MRLRNTVASAEYNARSAASEGSLDHDMTSDLFV